MAAPLKWQRDNQGLIAGDGKRFYMIRKATAGNRQVYQLVTQWPSGQTDKQNFNTASAAKKRAQTVTNNAQRREASSGT